MGKIAFLLSGQGAQKCGMALDFYKKNNKVKEELDTIEKMRSGTLDQMFHASKEVLDRTRNTQPCLFATDYAVATALIDSGIKPDALAGFSLGEIPTLAISGSLSLSDAFQLVVLRAKFTDEASKNTSKMVAVVRLDSDKVESICDEFEEMYPANYNTKQQTVVSGKNEEIKDFIARVKENRGMAIPLSVSGGFHSKFMAEASLKLKEYIKNLDFNKPKYKIYSNVTAKPYKKNEFKELLCRQIVEPVLWRKTILNMIEDGIDTFIEAGVGNVLCNMVKKIIKEEKLEDKNIYVDYVENTSDLERVIENVKK